MEGSVLANMRILLVNDDGIFSPGLKSLNSLAKNFTNDVWTVAPDTERSAASHALTLHHPLRVQKISPRTWSVTGTPTDCVYLALHNILKSKWPDLVLSGINRGSNIGDDITYSGTIAAAMEATLCGIPSIALSQMDNGDGTIQWKTAEHWGKKIIKCALQRDWFSSVLINVNFPNLTKSEVKGVYVSKQDDQHSSGKFEERIDPRGNTYYWIGQDKPKKRKLVQGTDVWALENGFVSITPLHLNLTHTPSLTELSKAFLD